MNILLDAVIAEAAKTGSHPSWIVEVLQNEKAAAAFITATGTALVGVIILYVVGIDAARRKINMTKADVPTVPMQAPPPTPPAAPPPPQTASAAEVQAALARELTTEALLLKLQNDLVKLRKSADRSERQAAKEEGELSSALVIERAESERLRAEVTRQAREIEAKSAHIADLERKGAKMLEQLRKDWSGE